ncbi:MAG TPA: energy transducer TonB [Pyrinomonadaceae bacterium]|jgi:TonB family protein
MNYLRPALFALLTVLPGASAAARETRPLTLAVLDVGEKPVAARAAERLAKALGSAAVTGLKLNVLDRDLSRAAARGVGYAGSLNMTLGEARALGAAVGCDFFLTGDAQTVRRSSSARAVYYESYASVFVVSAHTGRLVLWDRPAAEADAAEAAEAALLARLDTVAAARYVAAVAEAAGREERERFAREEVGAAAVIDLSTDEGASSNRDLREPAPYRRLRPAYTDAASRAEAEATVDALVEIGADGEVSDVRVVRWAGFGLDEEVVATVRRMHFRPAERDGEPVPVRVLLRYNFRKPPKG